MKVHFLLPHFDSFTVRYTSGAIRNSELVKVNFPGWRLRFYIEGPASNKYPKVPLDVVEILNNSGEHGSSIKNFH